MQRTAAVFRKIHEPLTTETADIVHAAAKCWSAPPPPARAIVT